MGPPVGQIAERSLPQHLRLQKPEDGSSDRVRLHPSVPPVEKAHVRVPDCDVEDQVPVGLEDALHFSQCSIVSSLVLDHTSGDYDIKHSVFERKLLDVSQRDTRGGVAEPVRLKEATCLTDHA